MKHAELVVFYYNVNFSNSKCQRLFGKTQFYLQHKGCLEKVDVWLRINSVYSLKMKTMKKHH